MKTELINYFNKLIINVFSKNAEYYQSVADYTLLLLDQYENPEILLQLLQNPDNLITKQTAEDINFRGKITFGSSIKQVKKILGQPYSIYDNPKIKEHIVLLYKLRTAHFKTKVELHFFKNRFFLGINIFDNNNSTDCKIIEEHLLLKYNICVNANDAHPIIIADKNLNYIYIDNNMLYMYRIVYVTGDIFIKDEIELLINQNKKRAFKKERLITKRLKKSL